MARPPGPARSRGVVGVAERHLMVYLMIVDLPGEVNFPGITGENGHHQVT